MTILYLREYSRMLRMKWSLNAKVKVQGQHKRQVQFLGHALNPENHAKTGGSFGLSIARPTSPGAVPRI